MLRILSFVLATFVLLSSSAQAGDVASRAWMTSEQYQQEFNKMTAAGYRPIAVDAYASPLGLRYAALWEKSSSTRAYIARHDLTIQQFQKEFDAAVAQGFRLIDVSISDGMTAAGLWVQGDGPAWEARADLTLDAMIQQYNEMSSAGYRLVDISGYHTVVKGVRFATIWVKNDGRAWTAWADMTSAQYQAKFNEMAAQGYWPVHVDGYTSDDAKSWRFAAIFEAGPANVAARHDMTQAQFQQAYNELTPQGYVITDIDGYSDGTQPLYVVLWKKK